MSIISQCNECGKNIINHNARHLAVICKGKHIDGKYVRSECRKIYVKRYKKENAVKIRQQYKEWSERRFKKIERQEVETVERRCLKCEKSFDSKSLHNRLCDECKRANENVHHKIGVRMIAGSKR